MSVINEALKKAKGESGENQKEKRGVFPEPRPAAVKSYDSQKIKVVLLIILLSLVVTFAILPLLASKTNIIYKTPSYQNQEAPLPPAGIAKVDAAPTESGNKSFFREPREMPPASSETRSFGSQVTLNGIMYSAKDPVAVINDELLKEGESAGDIKVVSIRRDSVDIEKAGSVVTLYLKRK